MQSFLRATHVALVSISLFSIAACSSVDFGHTDKKSSKNSEERAGGQNAADCLRLGNLDGGKGGTDVVVTPGQNDINGYNGKGAEPNPPGQDGGYVPCQTPGQYPGQTPGQFPGQNPGPVVPPCAPASPCADNGPGQFPPPLPIGNDCGKGGVYCDDGGPGQYPQSTYNGGTYDRHDLDGCMQAFRNQGYDTRGQWQVDMRTIKDVSVLSQSQIEDRGIGHSIVIIKSVSVLGSQHFKLLNPNALYCIENVSVLEQVLVTSCLQSNVVFGKDVNVLSGVNAQTVNCQY